MNKIRWGIIGAGNVAEVKSGPAFQRAAHSELVAVMRRDAAKARDFARRHGVPKWYDNADVLLADPDIDAVYVATPPAFHLPYTLAALRAGKHVYVEKPMALTAAECREMIAAEQASHGRKLCVAHYRRALDAFLKVRELLAAGAIGAPRLAEVRIVHPPKTTRDWRTTPAVSGGGLFHDLAPHHLDLMLLFFGTPEFASGLAMKQSPGATADDCVCGVLRFPHGVAFQGLWSFGVPGVTACEQCVITGDAGRIEFDFSGREITLATGTGTERFQFVVPPHIQQPMIERVTACFLGRAENPCTARVGMQVMEIIDAFTRPGA